ncbi:MAG TPA: M20/M25/M40 family metallo-hydrolase, partial [Burkholderiales bacterium]|nr:M20/M25/M40 family metallo-hydrolase [Burkholderiales bacterium]
SERALAEYIVHRLSKAGLDAYLQEVEPGRPNAVGVRPGTGGGRSLLFTGHMDTSYDGDESHLSGAGYRAHAVCDGDWIWGLGANNMKSGLAAALVVIEALAAEDVSLPGDVVYGAVVGETEKSAVDDFAGPRMSGYGVGTRHLILHGVTGDYAVLCEPTGLKVCHANMGVIWVKITTSGTIGHSALSRRPGTINAIEAMHAVQSHLTSWINAYEAAHVYLGEQPNVTISAIRGGLPWRASRNPYECHMYLDIRTVPGVSPDDVKRSLREHLSLLVPQQLAKQPEVRIYVNDPATELAVDHPIITAARAAHLQATGSEPDVAIRRFGSDATHMNRYGVPCVTYGPGGRVHPTAKGLDNEHVNLENMSIAARVYLAMALDICSRRADV